MNPQQRIVQVSDVFRQDDWICDPVHDGGSVVYRYGLDYALKEIKLTSTSPSDSESDSQYLNQIEEFQPITEQSHENVMKYYGAFLGMTAQMSQSIFVLMDFNEVILKGNEGAAGIRANSLQDLMLSTPEISLGNICSFAKDMLEGLTYLHEKQIAHLDLQPDNVFLYRPSSDSSVKAKIGGLDRRLQPQSALQDANNETMTLKFPCAAPEIIRFHMTSSGGNIYNSKDISQQADIWSIGAIILAMLLNRNESVATEAIEPEIWLAMEQLRGIPLAQTRQPHFNAELIPDNCPLAVRCFLKLCFDPYPPKRPTARALLSHWMVGHNTATDNIVESLNAQMVVHHYQSLLSDKDFLFCFRAKVEPQSACCRKKDTFYHWLLHPNDPASLRKWKYGVLRKHVKCGAVQITREKKKELMDDLKYLTTIVNPNIDYIMRSELISYMDCSQLLIFEEQGGPSLQSLLDSVQFCAAAIKIYTRNILEALEYLNYHGNLAGSNRLCSGLSAVTVRLSSEVYPGIYRTAKLGLSEDAIEITMSALGVHKGFYDVRNVYYVPPETLPGKATHEYPGEYNPSKGADSAALLWRFGILLMRLLTTPKSLTYKFSFDEEEKFEVVPSTRIDLVLRRVQEGWRPAVTAEVPEPLKIPLEQCFLPELERITADELLEQPYFQLSQSTLAYFSSCSKPSFNTKENLPTNYKLHACFRFINGFIYTGPRAPCCTIVEFAQAIRDLRYLDGAYPISMTVSNWFVLRPAFLMPISDVLLKLEIKELGRFETTKLRNLILPCLLHLSISSGVTLIIKNGDFCGFPKLLSLRLCNAVIEETEPNALHIDTLRYLAISPEEPSETVWNPYVCRLRTAPEFESLRQLFHQKPYLAEAQNPGQLWSMDGGLCSEYLQRDSLFS